MADFHVVGYMGYFLALGKVFQVLGFHGNDRFWYCFVTMVFKIMEPKNSFPVTFSALGVNFDWSTLSKWPWLQ